MADLMLDGRLFYARGPADANVQSANDVVVQGLARSRAEAERMWFLESTLATGEQSSDK